MIDWLKTNWQAILISVLTIATGGNFGYSKSNETTQIQNTVNRDNLVTDLVINQYKLEQRIAKLEGK